jgi:hypothetical protein
MRFKRNAILWIVAGFMAVGVSAEKPERARGHEQVSGWATNAIQSLEYGALLEVEGFGSRIGGESQSDIVLATVAFDVEALMTDWLMGHVGILWEQDTREDDNLDEAYIALGASETIPYYLVAGRFYQPVGKFDTVFISDPLTLELAEMNQTSAMAGYQNSWLVLNVGAFNGDVKEGVLPGDGGDDTISDFYAAVSLTPVDQVKFGAYWLSDLMETYTLKEVGEQIAQLPDYKKEGGCGAYGKVELGSLTLNAEYVSSINGYQLEGGSYIPSAFHLEASAQLHERIVVGIKYEGSNDLYASVGQIGPLQFTDKLPGESYGAVVSYAFHDHATLSTEFMHLAELDNNGSGNMATVQLSLTL